MSEYHKSVLLQEAIAYLHIQKGKKYIDATLGGGGHSLEIAKRGGIILGIDVDEEALAYIDKHNIIQTLTPIKGNFKDIDVLAKAAGFETVAGILFDLGVSSHQFDVGDRGFAFKSDGPLDMRMSKDLKVTAADLINVLSKGELYELFTKFGEETFAFAIARNIIRARSIKAIKTTGELSKIIGLSYKGHYGKINPATKVFQALRIAVNDELGSLKQALPKAVELLQTKGRLVVISFHSLEDRIVKHAFLEFAQKGLGTILTEKPVIPSEEEIHMNKRSRSAKLRVFERS